VQSILPTDTHRRSSPECVASDRNYVPNTVISAHPDVRARRDAAAKGGSEDPHYIRTAIPV
jgi:hypothetical protein